LDRTEQDISVTEPMVQVHNTAEVRRMAELLAAEAESLLGQAQDSGADELIADLHLRIALLYWDVLADPAKCAHHLDQIGGHPLAPTFLYSFAISEHNPDLLERAGGAIAEADRGSFASAGGAGAALRNLAEAWLYRFADPVRAASAARAGLAKGTSARSGSPDNLGDQLNYLLWVSLAACGEWAELAAALAESIAAEANRKKRGNEPLTSDVLWRMAEATHLYMDRLGNAPEAINLVRRFLGGLVSDGEDSAVQCCLLDHARELGHVRGAKGPAVDVSEVLRRRLRLVSEVPGAEAEAAATRFLLAGELAAAGQIAGAAEAMAALPGENATESARAAWATRLALMTRYQLAVRQGAWDQALWALEQLAIGPGAAAVAGCYVRRLAEMVDSRTDDRDRAAELWARWFRQGTSDEQAARSLERLLLPRDAALFNHLLITASTEAGRAAGSRRAAAVAESRLGDIPRARALLQNARPEQPDAADLLDEARLQRCSRELLALARSYRHLAEQHRQARAVAAFEAAAGAIALSAGEMVEAEEALRAAARQGARDPLARLGLAFLYRRGGRWRDLVTVLNELVKLVTQDSLRCEALREMGRTLAGELGEPRMAVKHYEAAVAIEPDDVKTLRALAELYGTLGQWSKAVALRQRAAELVAGTADEISLLLEIADIERRHRHDAAAALRAYETVLDLDEKCLAALTAAAELHRENKRNEALVDMLRRQAELVSDEGERLCLQLEMAAAIEPVDRQAALDGYLGALRGAPENPDALKGVQSLARKLEQWDALAKAFRSAPRTFDNLTVLAEALDKLEQWEELVRVRAAAIEVASSAETKADLAAAAARICRDNLDRPERAIEFYEQVLTHNPGHGEAQAALTELLDAGQRWPELAAAIEQQLKETAEDAVEDRKALLLRLGELRRDRLGQADGAAEAFEQVLVLDPHNGTALEALQALYEQLQRFGDVLRIIDLRAAVVQDVAVRVQLLSRVAMIKADDDAAAAVAAYLAAFNADPANRSTFTSMEKLCYQRKWWPAAMTLYERAIELVEAGEIRAYRLGDLYLRRGQVQLQYLDQPREAAASYLKVIELDPENDSAMKFLESIFSQQQDWEGLINAYKSRAHLAKDDEGRLSSLRRAARVAASKRKDPATAASFYEQVLAIDVTDSEALDSLERFHDQTQAWDKLIDVLSRRLESAPAGDAATTLLHRIAQICEDGLRDEQRAVENYRRILEIAPANKEALEALGRIYESTEQWAEFVDVTRRQIRVVTDRSLKALLYFKCGSVMEAKFGKEEDAIRYYDAAIKTSPSCLPAVHGLRDLYRRRKDWPRVIQTLELEVKLWQDDKERAGVFAQIGQIYGQQLREPDRALHYFESALAVDPECLPANRALFQQYYDAGDWERAQPLAQALAQKAMREGDPSQRSDFYLKRGVVARRTGDMRAAAESIIIALEIKPTNLDALDALGELAKAEPHAYDFPATYRELGKIYRKRDDSDLFMARVQVARAVMAERDGDLDAAEGLYAEALTMAPGDYTILSSLVDLHGNVMRWKEAGEAIIQFLKLEPQPPVELRVKALMRLAEIHDEGEMDAEKAAAVLREVIELAPENQDAHYQLAQQMYLLGRYDQARASIERVIDIAAAPGMDLSPENLARYYYYLGRIIEESGDKRSAASRYRRAAEYDPSYAPPALALAKRAVDASDQRAAETLLINAAHAAMEQGGAEAAVPLQRGLARILFAAGEREAAIEAYRGILAVEPDAAADRVALAEIYATEDVPRAIQEMLRVLDRDLRHGPAYRILASLYDKIEESERAVRLLAIMELLGYAEEQDRETLAKARAARSPAPLRGYMDDELRARLLLPKRQPEIATLYTMIAAEIDGLFPTPPTGANLVPAKDLKDRPLSAAISESERLFGITPEVYVGESVPGFAVVRAFPNPSVVIDQGIVDQSEAAKRFVLGRSYEAARGGYASVLQLTLRERLELVGLLQSLFRPEAEMEEATREFLRTLPKRAQRLIDRHRGAASEEVSADWIDTLIGASNRAGLFAADDFLAAAQMLLLLAGESQDMLKDGALALAAIRGGEDLVRFYLADEYHRSRAHLAQGNSAGGAAE
jgi:tetratricopeptide (TPR) repeat protein